MLTKSTLQELPELNAENFINRELSTVDFNARVLALAQDSSLPLLERLKFVAIVGNNLDEFFMVRVSSYIQKYKFGIIRTRPDGYTPTQLLTAIRTRVTVLLKDQRTLLHTLFDELEREGISVLSVPSLSRDERSVLRNYFSDEIYPVLTPLAADHARPFPFISNLSLNLGVYLLRESIANDPSQALNLADHYEFVRIKIPEALPRLVDLDVLLRRFGHADASQESSQLRYVWIDELIGDNLDLLFPGMKVIEKYPFRVTRNADIDYEHEKELELDDISALIENSVKERRFGSVVRLSVPDAIGDRMLTRLISELKVEPDRDVYRISGALGSSSLFELQGIDRPDLKYPNFTSRVPDYINQGIDIFSAIRQGNLLIHHPYDSFAPVEDFFRTAARDPDVLAIKVTLYRVGKNSPIVQALMEARDNDKQVAVLVELKARFDEENNLEWARALEHIGVHVTYGVEEFAVKTHSKVALVVRRERDRIRRYVHLGTGNYNASTARLYTDLGYFTCDDEIGEDVSKLFNRLTGYAPKTSYKRLLVAPEFLLPVFIRLIDNEIEAAKAGKPSHLIFKMNQIEEDVIIQKLYQASQAGVQIDLIVRGLCCLRPGLPGISENIRVKSNLGRYLEHARIYYFHNAPEDQRLYLGSADMMRRNLYNRVETVFPILDEPLRRKALRILATDMKSTVHSWELRSDAQYHPYDITEDSFDSQDIFMRDSFGLDVEIE
jgi:polyphosphate kinase